MQINIENSELQWSVYRYNTWYIKIMSHYLGFIRSTMYNLYQLENRLSTFRHLKKYTVIFIMTQ